MVKVRALQSFQDETGRHEPGDEFEMTDGIAAFRILNGLVAAVGPDHERAVAPEAERAVTVGRKKGR